MRNLFIFIFMIFQAWSSGAAAQEAGPILTGKVNTTVTRDVRMPFNAIIEEVLVKPGDPVEVGTPMLRYQLQDEDRRLLQRELTIGADTENLKSEVLDLQRELANTTAERNKAKHLVASGLGSKQALARLDSGVSSLNDKISLLRSTIKKAETNFSERIKELSGYFGKELHAGDPLPEELVLTSPIKGFVLNLQETANPGQLMQQGKSPIEVGQIDPVIIRVPVYETDLKNIKVGDAAEIEIPSLDNKKFKGFVTEISWASTDMNVANPSYYMVELTVPNPDLLMKPGFKAVARFQGIPAAE